MTPNFKSLQVHTTTFKCLIYKVIIERDFKIREGMCFVNLKNIWQLEINGIREFIYFFKFVFQR